MIHAHTKHLVVLALALAVSSCGRDNAAPLAEDTPAPARAVTGPAEALPATETTVHSIESVMVTRPQDAPQSILIQVSGVVGSPGWTDAKLLPLGDGDTGATRSFSLVARSPAARDAKARPEIVEAELRLEAIPTGTEMIRVVGATNEVSAFMPAK